MTNDDGLDAKPLFDAITSYQFDAVDALLTDNPALANTRDAEGWSPLATAVRYGCNRRMQRTRPMVERLIEAGAHVGPAEAAMLDDPDRLAALLDAGDVDLSATDPRGLTALHWACEVGSDACAKLLLEAGADPDSPSPDGLPIERAAHPGPCKPVASAACIELLKQHDATITAPVAAIIGDADRLRALIDADPALVDKPDANGCTPLYQAAHNLHLPCIELLLARGADVNATDTRGVSVIQTAAGHIWDTGGLAAVARLAQEEPTMDFGVAVQANQTEIVARVLKDEPSRANAPMDDHRPLWFAALGDAGDVIRLLVSHGAELNWHREHDGHDALHNAVWHGRANAAAALLECDADVNSRDNWQNTPLHNAVLRDRPQIARLLIEAGADLTAKNDKGDTPLALAWAKHREQIAAMIEAPGDAGRGS